MLSLPSFYMSHTPDNVNKALTLKYPRVCVFQLQCRVFKQKAITDTIHPEGPDLHVTPGFLFPV